MSRLSLSPRITVKSPRNLEVHKSNQEKLPSIKDNKTVNPIKHSLSKVEDLTNKPSPRVINFFDMPSPMNQKKVDLVKTALDKRNIAHSQYKDSQKLEDSNNLTRNDLLECKTELDLQTRFLKDKNLSKQARMYTEKAKISSYSIGLNKIQALNEENNKKPLNLEESFQSVRKSEDYAENVEKTEEKVFSFDENSSENIKNNDKDVVKKAEYDKIISENIELKALLSEANADFLQIKQEKNMVSAHLEQQTLQTQEFRNILETQIKTLHEEIDLKSKDYEVLKEQLKKSEFNRKKFIEAIKDLEVDTTIAKKKAEHSQKDLENLQVKYEALQSELKLEKEKFLILEELNKEIEKLKYELGLMKAEKEEMYMEKCVARESLEAVRKNFDSSRIVWRDKEINYEDIIKNLLEQIQTERGKNSVQVAETAKLRKALSLKDNDSFNTLNKDEIIRVQAKMAQLDKENGEFISEIEKLKKNIEYYTFLLKNKEEVIQKLNEENEEFRKKGENLEERFKFNEGYSEKSLQGVRKVLKNWMSCSICADGVSMSILKPCKHLLCSKCEPEDATCPICSSGIMSVQMFTEFSKIRETFLLFDKLSPL